jgi:hypothetical protein
VHRSTGLGAGIRAGCVTRCLASLRRAVVGVERGRSVSSSVLVTSRPWGPPLILAVLALGLWITVPGVTARWTDTLERWWAEGPVHELTEGWPIPASAAVAGLAGVVVFLGVSTWSWPIRLAILAATWAYGTYALGITSGEQVGDVVHWLASQPGVDVFDPPPRGSVDASSVVVFSLALAPFIVGLLFLLLWAWSAFTAEFLRPLAVGRFMPEWVLMTLVLIGLAGVAYVAREFWLPWCLWVLGVVARAIVIHWGA